jgi:diguanylate cyclase (GGDEF)-like protein/PAS domain S-box-containing protein
MCILASTGCGLGVFGIVTGEVAGLESALILSCLLFSSATLITLIFFHQVALQKVTAVSTIFFFIYLCVGAIISALGNSSHIDFFIYLIWFFPLLVFNKLVNEPAAERMLAKILIFSPPLLIACLFSHLILIFKMDHLLVIMVFCLSYISYGFMLNVVTRYREAYIIERERVEALKVEAELLESISDSFISLDAECSLVYLNDSACAEFGVLRQTALKKNISHAVPSFFSQTMLIELRAAAGNSTATMFEAQDKKRDRWYEMRCFPRADGLSVYFRNITESVSSREKLEQAHNSLRQHAELLDKAQDAIFVQDMAGRILYWNKGAERIYGWTSEKVTGQLICNVFRTTLDDMNKSVASVLRQGEWTGELAQHDSKGNTLTVESRCTLVKAEDGRPRAILSINTDITNRKKAEARIEHLAFFDVLTGLPNRLLLHERLEKALQTAIHRGNMGALLFIDLDDFKTLNDTLGHDVGDLLLEQVALRLTSCVRRIDTVARLGGDEFVVMLEGLSEDLETATVEAMTTGNKILEAFLRPYKVGNDEFHSTTSIGITVFPEWSDTVDDLLKRADLAMYRAKSQGRNVMCLFDPAMQILVASRAELQADLRRASQNREFEVHYQPQVNRCGNVIGAEALLRWRHPGRGMISPDEFIPLAEEAGLIVELGRWVLETACSQLAKWSKLPAMEHLTISVNVSARQLLDAYFVDLVRDVLRKSGANPRKLKLEITESAAIDKMEDTIAKMTALRIAGVGLSLDDFGTGYSSLSRLRRLPLDQLKIDRSFVSDVLTDSKVASIARTIIALGHSLNLSVIAEGVETEGQRTFLETEGCHLYQGYLFSAALTASSFEAFAAAAPLAANTV